MTFDLPQLTVSGTPQEMGRQYGEHWRAKIAEFVANREAAVTTYFEERGLGPIGVLLEAGAACLERTRGFDASGHAEHLGLAEGAQLDPFRLFTATNMTDIRDVIALPGTPHVLEDEGCTAALVPPALTHDGTALQGQTWDLNGPDVEFVIALHRLPDEGPETWTVTCAGCQTLMGMNQHGISVGTTNLKTHGAKVGVPYLSVLHKALSCAALEQASAVCEKAPVAGSHSYWVGDAQGAIEWERTPDTARSRTTQDGPLTRTNHCLFDENTALETDLSPSTHERRARMETLLAASDAHSVESLKRSFANRDDGAKSINRFTEDGTGAATNAVVVCNGADREFWACRGQADRGEWVQLKFDR